MSKDRTFGWVQNCANFNNLKKTVEIFDANSAHHQQLKDHILPTLVKDKGLCTSLRQALERKPLQLTHRELVGKGGKSRSDAACNALIQASIHGQGTKKYTDDWTSECFLRWAHCLGFIWYQNDTGLFELTPLGLQYLQAENNKEEKKIILEAILAYPPAVRVLQLLFQAQRNKGEGQGIVTKFEIGRKLGFAGEKGFTSYPEDILVDYLHATESSTEKNKIRNNTEGTSDKYARMIGGWLVYLELARQCRKVFPCSNGQEYIGHAFQITEKGRMVYKEALGSNRQKKVYWEMFATKEIDRWHLRTRRALLLKRLMNSEQQTEPMSLLKAYMEKKGYSEPVRILKNDLIGFMNCGIAIEVRKEGRDEIFSLKDNLNDFFIPKAVEKEKKEPLENLTRKQKERNIIKEAAVKRKTELYTELPDISADFIELMEIALDKRQNRLLEMKVMELLVKEYSFQGMHLGGQSKPDGAAYHKGKGREYGVIIDTKGYELGFSIPVAEADKMLRYIADVKEKNTKITPNEWWKVYPSHINQFVFLFVSGFFRGEFKKKLEMIHGRSCVFDGDPVFGGVLSIEQLLYGAQAVKTKKLGLESFPDYIKNDEVIFSC